MQRWQALAFDPLHTSKSCIDARSLDTACLPAKDQLEVFQNGLRKGRTSQPTLFLDSPHLVCRAFRNTENGEESSRNNFGNLLDISEYPRYGNARNRPLKRMEPLLPLDFLCKEPDISHIRRLPVL